MRVLAVDFGDRRTGLAATDHSGTIAVPLPALTRLDDEACALAIRDIAEERQCDRIVVGMPLDRSGGEGPRAKRTKRFGALLAARVPCPVEFVDERNTTDEAHALLKDGGLRAAQRKKFIDSVAALVILRRYLSAGPTP